MRGFKLSLRLCRGPCLAVSFGLVFSAFSLLVGLAGLGLVGFGISTGFVDSDFSDLGDTGVIEPT